MNIKKCILVANHFKAAAMVIAASLSGMPTESSAVVTLRWAFEVKGLEATSWSIFDPDPVSYTADFNGYFDAQDRDANGKITKSEVIAVESAIGLIYPSPADILLNFDFDPLIGLSYKIDGYHYQIDFGAQASRFSDTGSTTYRWTASTITEISMPVAVPEPSMLTMAAGGLGLLGLVLAGRGRLRRAWTSDPQLSQ